ncbi:uncharacterized protein LOC130696605 [Daphnia carinata]|uniref:uncharacterized protein LOC130696605 n=1 Tax=Daphnia carinata TaxID=120202 RepID=UPI002579D710|nr:uncharacterized protein LOC130696605 [Daphnia carinata]
MTRRAFNKLTLIMPRISRHFVILFGIGFLILTVWADINGQPDSNRTQVALDAQRFKDNITEAPVLCECEFFVQSWKTSHMIRLPMGIQPVRANSSLQSSNKDSCVLLCRNQLPPPPENDNESNWGRIFKGACQTLIANEFTTRQSEQSDTGNDNEPTRGCLQAYARSVHTRTWVPMGIEYRKLLSCTRSRRRRSLPEGRKLSNVQSSLNSVDAQSAVIATSSGITVRPPEDSPKKPTTQEANTSPLKIILKRFGLFGPVVESLVDMFDGGAWRELLNNFRLGSYVDRYQRLAIDYAEEMDAGHCFFEYLTYNIFNHRFAQRTPWSGSRGLEDDAVGFLTNAATNFLKSENASEVISSLFSMIPRPAMQDEVSNTLNQQSAPDVQEVAMSIARFYLRNYFSTLSGSKVRVDEQDPTNNPDSLADMIEQVSRPVFLSIFGVVPGVPASGKLDHLLLMSSKPEVSEIGLKPPEFRNKLVPEPVRTSSSLLPPLTLTTGNSFFDIGNNIVSTFQRASDATHGLYCVKQYAVNRMWDGFRGSMRKMMRAIPNVG